MGESVRHVDPGTDFYIFLADAPVDEPINQEKIVDLSALHLEDLLSQTFRYSVMEFATAIKPACFKHLLNALGYETAVYLDPDIQLFAPLDRVVEAFRGDASFVLTPHILAPLTDGKMPNDLDILRSGTFNLGFAAARKCDETMAFLDWWEERLRHQGYSDLPQGLFVDQKFAELAPSFLPQLSIIRDPGYNVAYWNLLHRPVTRAADGWRAGGCPLIFFHFSGVAPGQPRIFSKHQTRFTIDTIGPASDLVGAYLDLLHKNGHARWSAIPYAFGVFEDGTPIPEVIRRLPPAGKPPHEWWKAYDAAYWNEPSERVDQAPGCKITRLMLAIHESRPDIQAQFPLTVARGRRDFHAWFVAHGGDEHEINQDSREACLSGGARSVPSLSRFLARIRLALR